MEAKEALFYKKLKNKTIQCQLCPHFCIIKNKARGRCGARENRNGTLYSIVYGKPCSFAIDPIEKKPLYHFHPGSKTLTLSTVGCNLRCKHCQNWHISQKEVEQVPYQEIAPKQIIKLTKNSGLDIVSFSYTEPTIFYEYMLDIAKLAKKNKMKCVMVSNGFINPEPLKKIIPYIDAFNIDVKSIKDTFYKKICDAKITPILKAIKIIYKAKKHLEITNLIIPGLNDSEENIKDLVHWIKKNLSVNIPLHFSAFYPCYKLSKLSPTSIETVITAKKIAVKLGMKNVYTGNI